jgi:hypothetical protein
MAARYKGSYRLSSGLTWRKVGVGEIEGSGVAKYYCDGAATSGKLRRGSKSPVNVNMINSKVT